jgi:hypothetical protein
VHGTVYGEEGRPLGGAEVSAGGRVAETGENGSYDLGTLAPGRLTLRVRRIGYRPQVRELELLPATDLLLDLQLDPAPPLLDSIVVTGAPGAVILGSELSRRGPNLAAALDGWEGIVMRPGPADEASPTVRGSAPDEVLVLLDGFPLNDPYTGRADLRRVPSSGVARVTLGTGIQTVRAGARAVAGVIRIESADRAVPELSLWASTQGVLGGTASGAMGPLSATLMRDGFPDRYAYQAPAVRGGGIASRVNAGGTVWSLESRLAAPVELSLRTSASERGVPGPVTNPTPDARATDWSLFAGWRTRGSWVASGSVEVLATRFRDPAPPVGSPYDDETRGVGLSGDLARAFRLFGGQWQVGGGAREDRFHGDGVRDGAHFRQAGIRVEGEEAMLGDRLTVSPAARVDWWEGRTSPVASARVDFRWGRGSTRFELGVGSGVAAPVLADLLFREGTGVRVNPDLRPERVRWELDGGVHTESRLGGLRAAFGLHGFYGRVQDLVLWGLSPGFGFTWMPQNFDVRRRGGELTFDLDPGAGLSLHGVAGLSLITYDRPGGQQVLYRPRFTNSASVEWRRGRWGASGRWSFVGVRYPNGSGLNPLPAFGLLDGSLECRLARMFSLRVDGYDLADAQPSYISGFPAPGRRFTFTINTHMP